MLPAHVAILHVSKSLLNLLRSVVLSDVLHAKVQNHVKEVIIFLCSRALRDGESGDTALLATVRHMMSSRQVNNIHMAVLTAAAYMKGRHRFN